jgi:ubiquinone/menaquinone biosynthesis C-methylase UbiE
MAHDFKNSTFDAVDLRYLVTEDIGVGSRGSHSDSAVAQEYNLPNFRFHLHNMLKKKNLPFDNDTFDYLQQSLTTITYSTQDWSRVIPELIRVVCPGGTIQLLEIDMIPHGLGPNGKILANEGYFK